MNVLLHPVGLRFLIRLTSGLPKRVRGTVHQEQGRLKRNQGARHTMTRSIWVSCCIESPLGFQRLVWTLMVIKVYPVIHGTTGVLDTLEALLVRAL